MIVQQFGGEINVNSALGYGSEFYFTFMLDALNENDTFAIKRIKSPVKQEYKKIMIEKHQQIKGKKKKS